MTEQEEFEFRLRLEKEKGAVSLVDQIPGGLEPYTPPQKPDKPKTGAQRAANLISGAMSTAAGIMDIPSKIANAPWLKSEATLLAEGKSGLPAAQKDSLEYMAGQVADPVAMGIGSGAMNGAQLVKKAPGLLKAMLGGAAGGSAVSGLQGDSAITGAAIGGAIPAALGGAGAIGKKIYNIADQVFSNEGAKRAAGRVANDVAGSKVDDVIGALSNARRTETAKQAVVPTGSREFPGLMALAEGNAPTASGLAMDAQVARRASALEGVKPDLARALAERDMEKMVNYGLAFNQKINADPALARLAKDPYFKQAIGSVSDLAEHKGITPKSDLTEYLHTIKTRLDEMVSQKGDTALKDSEKRAVQEVRKDLIEWLGNKNPTYNYARLEHQRLSQPINQAEAIDAIQNVMRGVAGSERLTPLVNALTRGEERLVKGATGFGDDLSQILTPRQMKVVNAVQSQAEKNKLAQQFAAEGQGKARSVFQQDEMPISFPNMLLRPVMIANAIIKRAEGHGKQATLDALSTLNLNPRELAEVMRNASKEQRAWMAEAIARNASPYTIGAQQAIGGNDK